MAVASLQKQKYYRVIGVVVVVVRAYAIPAP